MGAKQHHVQIRGLVRLMNTVRDQLRTGISPEEEAEFRTTVRDALRTVDNICRANRITQQDLPTPSRRAYDYLKGLNLDDLPRPTRDQIITENSIHVSGIPTSCGRHHLKLAKVVASESPPYQATSAAIQRLICDLRTEASAIEGLCEDAGGTPAALPLRSRRGYQWMKFLGDPLNLIRHLRALSVLTEAAKRAQGSAPTPRIEIFPASVLYRTKMEKRVPQILINEGFIDAPDRILETLIRVALRQAKDSTALRSIKAYAISDRFVSVRSSVLQTADTLSGDGKGHVHDLNASFERVNREYFGGAVDAPRMIWSRRPTTRKLGHYDAIQETVMVSMSLDRANVPAYVVDFVVYHEILHKTMGTKVINGRQHAHTTAFKKAERAYKHYREAQTFLEERSYTVPP